MKKMSDVFELPVTPNIDDSIGSVTSAEGAMNLTVHELGNTSHFSAKGRLAARIETAELIAHAINHVDALAEALESAIIAMRANGMDCYDNFELPIAALKAYRGEK